MRVTPWALWTFCFLLGGAPARAADDKDLEKFQGEWVVASQVLSGEKSAETKSAGVKLVIKKTAWTLVSPRGRESKYTYVIDSTKDPKTIDITRGTDDRTSPGIYKLDGDTLTICHPTNRGDRPKAFESTAENRCEVVVYKRAEKK